MAKSIMQDKHDRTCWECGSTRNLEEHHIFRGSRRTKSETWGLKVYLCWNHHNHSKYGVHGANTELKKRLWSKAQKLFIEKYGQELWDREFGKNFIEDEE